MYKKKCEGCGIRFESKRPHARFHNPKCRFKKWATEHPRLVNTDSKIITTK